MKTFGAAVLAVTIAFACPAFADGTTCHQTLEQAHAGLPASEGYLWVTTDDEAIVKRVAQMILENIPGAFKLDDVKTLATAARKGEGSVEIGLFDKSGCIIIAGPIGASELKAIIGEDS